jgi:methylenetetrahydrofolate reductase (NADPH)
VLTSEEKLKLLRINSFLGNASLNLLKNLAAAAVERSFEKGDFIFARNDPALAFYILVNGKIGHPEVQVRHEPAAITRQIATTGQLFGFSAIVPGQPMRVVSARCEAPTKVLTVDGKWFQDLCARYGAPGQEILRDITRAHTGYEHAVLGRTGWISARNVSKRSNRDTDPAILDDCSFEIRPGEFCALLGEAGCGKSTLVNMIAATEPVSDGVIYLDGVLINRPGIKRQRPTGAIFVWQQAHAARSTVLKYLARRIDTAAAGTLATELLGRFELASFENRQMRELDPAVRIQVEIIEGLMHNPSALLLDDPLRGLSSDARDALGRFLGKLHEIERKTILLTTRDSNQAILLANQVLVMGRKPGTILGNIRVDLPRPRAPEQRDAPDFLRLRNAIERAAQAPAQTQADEAELPWPQAPIQPTDAGSGRVIERGPATNAIKTALANGRFFWTIEFIPSVDKILRDELHKLGGVAEVMLQQDNLAGFAVTDRVHSDRDPDPVAAASHLLDHSGKQPLVHFSGKDRHLDDLDATLTRMQEMGLENVLMLTGDRLKNEPRDRRPRYLESVAAIHAAKKIQPGLHIGAALNPFKYREEDAMAQYLKLGKKVGAGADFIITQIGFDMSKYEEALFWIDTRNYRVPLIANVMQMTAARARYMRRHQLAGVTITDSLLALLEDEERLLPDKGAARGLRRLALQILGVRYYGYAGIQLTGFHHPDKLAALNALIAELADLCSDRITWNLAWKESLTSPAGWRANPAPAGDAWYLSSPRNRRAALPQRTRYVAMDGIHAVLFDKGPAAKVMAALTSPIRRHGVADKIMERVERAIKAPLFGCETCGMCRLAQTQYVCPETCPKGLANGPCGGTTENLCEFRDRECIHSVKYRIAKDSGVLHELETRLIPAVSQSIRHTSSWPPHFRGEGPQIDTVDFSRTSEPGD